MIGCPSSKYVFRRPERVVLCAGVETFPRWTSVNGARYLGHGVDKPLEAKAPRLAISERWLKSIQGETLDPTIKRRAEDKV